MVNVSDFNHHASDPRVLSSLEITCHAASLLVFVTGYVTLTAWLLNLQPLKSLWPGLVTLKANAAFCLMLSGFSLWLMRNEAMSQRKRFVARSGSVAVLVVGLLTLAEYLFASNLGIDQLLFRESAGAPGTSHPGRMSPLTAFSMALLGTSLFLLTGRRGPFVSQILALAAAPISLTALLGYLYGVKRLYGFASFTEMAPQTAVALLLLCLGILSARPERGVMKVISSESVTGMAARRLLIASVGVPASLGWLRLAGQRAGLYGTEFGVSLFVMSTVVIFGALVFWHIRSLYGVELERRWAEGMLRRSHEELEKRVRERTADLQQANERLQRLDEMKSNFLALAAHELKTPLTAIRGCLSLIAQGRVGVLTKKQKHLIDLVEEASGRLHRLVEDLLDLSKIELGQIKMEMAWTDLRSLLKREITVVRVQAQNKGIEVEEAVDDHLREVRCDRDRIREVVDNLISNAVRYTPAQGRIRIQAANIRNGVQIDVSDTGVGIKREDQERIFEPFQYLRKSGFDGEKSTGLGLALVKKIIEAHGGQIMVKSREGEGSTFSVTLPAERGRNGNGSDKGQEENSHRRR